MTFDSVGGAEDGRTYKVRDEEVRTLRPSRLPNEFTRTGPNMPGILHYIKKIQHVKTLLIKINAFDTKSGLYKKNAKYEAAV